jgi:hypothetical protein
LNNQYTLLKNEGQESKTGPVQGCRGGQKERMKEDEYGGCILY